MQRCRRIDVVHSGYVKLHHKIATKTCASYVVLTILLTHRKPNMCNYMYVLKLTSISTRLWNWQSV